MLRRLSITLVKLNRGLFFDTLIQLQVKLLDTLRIIQVCEIIVQSCYSLAVYHCVVQFVKKTDDIKVI